MGTNIWCVDGFVEIKDKSKTKKMIKEIKELLKTNVKKYVYDNICRYYFRGLVVDLDGTKIVEKWNLSLDKIKKYFYDNRNEISFATIIVYKCISELQIMICQEIGQEIVVYSGDSSQPEICIQKEVSE